MDRKTFINQMTGGLALTCVSCMMQACSKEGTTTPGGGSGTNTNPGNTVTLSINLNSQLLAVKDFIADKGVIVVRIATGNVPASFVAYSSACPHAGSTITFLKATNAFNCPAHGSNFSLDGLVLTGPAVAGLQTKTIEIVGTTLNVK